MDWEYKTLSLHNINTRQYSLSATSHSLFCFGPIALSLGSIPPPRALYGIVRDMSYFLRFDNHKCLTFLYQDLCKIRV